VDHFWTVFMLSLARYINASFTCIIVACVINSEPCIAVCTVIKTKKLKKKKKKQLASSTSEAVSQASFMDQAVYTDNSAQTG